MLHKEFLGTPLSGGYFDGYIIPASYTEASQTRIGYSRGFAGQINGRLDLLDHFYIVGIPNNEGTTDNLLGVCLWSGKADADGNVAHAYLCDITSDIFSKKNVFLVPTASVQQSNNTYTVVYPGNFYVLIDDLPDELRFFNKQGSVLSTIGLTYPMDSETKILGDYWSMQFYKDGVTVPWSSANILTDTIVADSPLKEGVKCNISMRITPLSGGGI